MSSRLNGFRVWGRAFQLPAAAERAARTDGPCQGETVEEALTNLREATELYLEEFPLTVAGRPLLTSFHVTEHA